jgi:uncharacterized membrane protein YcaP (DUF421 family)
MPVQPLDRFETRTAGVAMNAAIDWNSVFVPSLGIAEVVVRGSIMYLALFAVFRFLARRQAGHFGPADLLVVVLIADASQNALGKDYNSITEGIVLVLTIVGWDYLIDWITWKFPATRSLLKAPSLTLIRDGKVSEKSLRLEMLSEDDLKSQLRQHDVEQYSDVKLAILEGDGRMSVIKR